MPFRPSILAISSVARYTWDNAISHTLNSYIVIVVFPADAKAHHSIRLRNSAKYLELVILSFVLDKVENVRGYFLNGLDEFRLPRISPL